MTLSPPWLRARNLSKSALRVHHPFVVAPTYSHETIDVSRCRPAA